MICKILIKIFGLFVDISTKYNSSTNERISYLVEKFEPSDTNKFIGVFNNFNNIFLYNCCTNGTIKVIASDLRGGSVSNLFDYNYFGYESLTLGSHLDEYFQIEFQDIKFELTHYSMYTASNGGEDASYPKM